MRSTVAGLAFWLAAIVRTLQRVASFGTIVIVVTMMAASLAAGICLGRPLRGRSEISPARLEIELFDGAVQLCLKRRPLVVDLFAAGAQAGDLPFGIRQFARILLY